MKKDNEFDGHISKYPIINEASKAMFDPKESRESSLKEEIEILKANNNELALESQERFNKIQELEQLNITNTNLLNIASGDFQKASERMTELEQQNKELREALRECIDMIHTLEYYNDDLDQKIEKLLKQ